MKKNQAALLLSILMLAPAVANATDNAGDFGNTAGSNASFGTSGSNGGIAVGSGYANTYDAPTNGIIVEGAVGIGTTDPGIYSLNVNGAVTLDALLFLNGNTVPFGQFGGLLGNYAGGTYAFNPDLVSTSHTNYVVMINPSINQSATAGYIALDINPTETSTGSGNNYLQRWAVGGVENGHVNDNGGLSLGTSYAGTVAPAGGAIIQGNVGIGTSTPSYPLHVVKNGTSVGVGVMLQSNDTWGNGYILNNTSAGGHEWNLYTYGSASGMAGIFDFHDSTTNVDALTIGANDYVGIGTTSPSYPLTVIGDAAIYGLSGVNASLSLTDGDNENTWDLAVSKNDGFFTIYDQTHTLTPFTIESNSPNYSFILTSSGKIGIGTETPGYTLHVNGSVAGTSAYVNLSDARYKKNIKSLDIGLKEVEQLKPVSFEWKEPKDGGMEGQQIGFVAQDVEKVLPSVVLTQDNDEKTKGMKYSDIIPVLTKAIQELKAQNDEQAKTIDSLRHDFEMYKSAHP